MAFNMKYSPLSQVGGVSPLNEGKGCAKSVKAKQIAMRY